ncbi:MAG: DUF4412 domain-containing protein [bacterium]
MRIFLSAISLGAVTLAALPAIAGVKATTSSTDRRAGNEPVISALELEGRRLRMDVQNSGDGRPPMTMLFDGSTGVLVIVNHTEKSITRLDRNTGQAIHDRMESARKQMQEQLKQLPPDQRAMAEKMFASHLGIAGMDDPKVRPTAAPIQVRKTGRKDSVSGHDCVIFEIVRAGGTSAEICAASWAASGIREKDLRALEDLGKFQTRMLEVAGGQGVPAMHHPFDLFRKVEGIPLRTRQKNDDGSWRETVFTSIENAEIPAARFEPPTGYTQRPLLPPAP